MNKRIFFFALLASFAVVTLTLAITLAVLYANGVILSFITIAEVCAVSCIPAIVAAYTYARFLTAKLARDINALDLDKPEKLKRYPELSPLLGKIQTRNKQVSRHIEQLSIEHQQREALRREFTANVSHELKTPLTSISGFAEIIRDKVAKPEDISRFAGNIYTESQRLIALVGDIIRLSEMDEKKLSYTMEPVELYSLVETTLKQLKPGADKRGIKLRLEGGQTYVDGVTRLLEEIVYNLCDNAIKYNKDNGEVKVTLRSLDEGVELSVEDTGIGIPEKDFERIFERFYRVNKSHSKNIGGTGLGLSIVKHASAVHKAELTVKSRVGSGTIIRLLFPVQGK